MPTLELRDSKNNLYRFIVHFFLVNILLSFLVIANYVSVLKPLFAMNNAGPSVDLFLALFIVVSSIAQMTILFFLCSFCIIIVNTFLPDRLLIFALSIFSGSALIFLLVADSVVFNLFHMHYAELGWEIFKANAFSQVISFSLFENIELIIGIILFILFEFLIAKIVWRAMKIKSFNRGSYGLSIAFIICVITSYSFNYMARTYPNKFGLNADLSYLMVKTTRFIPYYDELYRLSMPGDNPVRYIKTNIGDVALQVRGSNNSLNYPKQPLTCKITEKPLNIVVIAIDTWRHDAMSAEVTPHIYQFSKKALQFNNHWSGGNCTQAGLFSLFYGIPINYWTAVLNQNRGPQLIKQLIKSDYQIKILASAQLNFPAFDKTIFRDVKSLMIRTPGDTSVARDKFITREFLQFLDKRDTQKPFFSFLFYDAVHNYCEPAPLNAHPFKPWLKECNRVALTKNTDPTLYVNRYKNSVHFVDSEIKKLLTALEQKNLLENTVVIITTDHGEEINDNHSGFWQHTSAYTTYQLRVPLIVYWPKETSKAYTHFTTHYDVVPTLMTRVLNCKNPINEYSTGKLLLTPGQRSPLISGSYSDYAIISKNQVLRIYHSGDYILDDKEGHPIGREPLIVQPLQQAYKQLTEYFEQTH